MKTLFLTTALLVAALLSIPEHAAAQSGCITPEHCVNHTDGTQTCEPGMVGFDFEVCYIAAGFCQLEDRCGFAYLDLPADEDVTPAGTLRSVATVKNAAVVASVLTREKVVRSCRGLIVAVAESSEVRPAVIVMD